MGVGDFVLVLFRTYRCTRSVLLSVCATTRGATWSRVIFNAIKTHNIVAPQTQTNTHTHTHTHTDTKRTIFFGDWTNYANDLVRNIT